jgi:hypothetical protein
MGIRLARHLSAMTQGMFGTEAEINEAFASIGKFVVKHEVGLLQFIGGSPRLKCCAVYRTGRLEISDHDRASSIREAIHRGDAAQRATYKVARGVFQFGRATCGRRFADREDFTSAYGTPSRRPYNSPRARAASAVVRSLGQSVRIEPARRQC